MIGIDTNVLVRYLAQDDAAQAAIATEIVEGFTPEEPGFVSQVVLVETVWVLTRAYRMTREAIADAVEVLLRSRELIVEHTEAGYLALATYRATKADFADALIAHGGRLAGCSETVTFDRGAASHAGMRLFES
ncbi:MULTISPECIES: PIN domain-containing protein [Paracoccus]|uniref:Putative nucleic-acid-binding protein n=1 Tax=Paracoccus versutus TaxID=34007 RepID=A0A3D9XCM9_PARVE|nr:MULTISPECIES: PIN domain-containing protein [Paracoccus]MDK8873393.1 PIN domain-containing protein [Paracoccus sp. SSJ]REF68300.1 putative nucleic-acid-binding protein [Paracoccus versutus]RNI16145.1 PIN domain-containing protein [Paracoccus pantotrophus]WGR58963.1 PIN domain-containing protein [Paracoccus versutus]SFY25153.1 Predicted nucleic-acid-binding protein, contains PIN domain [Paracoccus pantotrophus]